MKEIIGRVVAWRPGRMKVGMSLAYSGEGFRETVDQLVELEAAGLDAVACARRTRSTRSASSATSRPAPSDLELA